MKKVIFAFLLALVLPLVGCGVRQMPSDVTGDTGSRTEQNDISKPATDTSADTSEETDKPYESDVITPSGDTEPAEPDISDREQTETPQTAPETPAVTEAETTAPHTGAYYTREYAADHTDAGLAYDFMQFLPADTFQSDEKRPLVIFLHGSGERANTLTDVVGGRVPGITDGSDFDRFILIAPQCPSDQNWDVDLLQKLLDYALSVLPVDTERIYLTGYSLGGAATWRWACAYPDQFAALLPICGFGETEAVTVLADLPIWIFHGEKDTIVPVSCSKNIVDSLRNSGSKCHATFYSDADHSIWSRVYRESYIFDWLLDQRRCQKDSWVTDDETETSAETSSAPDETTPEFPESNS